MTKEEIYKLINDRSTDQIAEAILSLVKNLSDTAYKSGAVFGYKEGFKHAIGTLQACVPVLDDIEDTFENIDAEWLKK